MTSDRRALMFSACAIFFRWLPPTPIARRRLPPFWSTSLMRSLHSRASSWTTSRPRPVRSPPKLLTWLNSTPSLRLPSPSACTASPSLDSTQSQGIVACREICSTSTPPRLRARPIASPPRLADFSLITASFPISMEALPDLTRSTKTRRIQRYLWGYAADRKKIVTYVSLSSG